jgi:hypothetical protein
MTSVGHSRLIHFTQLITFNGNEDYLVVEGPKAQNGITVLFCGP